MRLQKLKMQLAAKNANLDFLHWRLCTLCTAIHEGNEQFNIKEMKPRAVPPGASFLL
jgi:hypothetical protein